MRISLNTSLKVSTLLLLKLYSVNAVVWKRDCLLMTHCPVCKLQVIRHGTTVTAPNFQKQNKKQTDPHFLRLKES